MTEETTAHTAVQNGVLTIRGGGEAGGQLLAGDIIKWSTRMASADSISRVVVTAAAIQANTAWRGCSLPFALEFLDCTFVDSIHLDHTAFMGLALRECRFARVGTGSAARELSAVGAVVDGDLRVLASDVDSLDLFEAVIHGHVTLGNLNPRGMRLDRVRVDGDIVVEHITEQGPVSLEGPNGADLKPVVWGSTFRSMKARSIVIRDSTFTRGVNLFGASAESVTIERCRIGTALLNTYEVPAFPTLGNSILGGEATLLMSSVEAKAVQVGPAVWVGGDVRMLNLQARSLRVGADTDWLSRVNGVPAVESALIIDGGILYAKDARSARTEIQVFTGRGRTPSMLVNDADLGDLSLYRLTLGGTNGRVCLYGTAYSNLEFKSFRIDEGGLAFPRHRGDTELPGLLVLRDYAYAHRYAPLSVPPDQQNDGEWERERKKFRGQPYLALARHLAATGDSSGSREALICMQDDARRLSSMPWPSRVWNWISGFTVKYGYSVHRTVLPLILMVLVAGVVVHGGRVNDNFTAMQPGLITDNASVMGESPTGTLAQDALKSSECTRLYPCMESVSYTVDMLLPFGNFTQVGYWQPSSEWGWRHVLTGLVAGVWIATTILLAALSGIARRSPEA